jgi:hypothetical protein
VTLKASAITQDLIAYLAHPGDNFLKLSYSKNSLYFNQSPKKNHEVTDTP